MSALAPGNAAHIIAVMRIAHRAQVYAAVHQARREANYASAVGDNIGILSPREGHALHVQLIYLQAAGRDAGVHLRPVFTFHNTAGAVSGNTARKALAAYCSFHFAALYAAVVLSGNTAHIVKAGDLAIETAIFYTSVAGTYQAAHLIAAVVRLHPALHVQVADAAVRLEIAEKSLIRAIGSQDKVADGMAASVKAAAEAGYR